MAEGEGAVVGTALPVIQDVYDYEKLKRIGEGTFGIVYKARDRRTGKIVALKRLRLDRERDGMPVTSVRELRSLQETSHPNIVALLGVVTGASLDSVFLVFEYCPHDLAHIVDRLAVPLVLSEIKCLLHQLLSALAYLHARWTMHRDLKPSNLLLDEHGQLKVCDFGLVRRWAPRPEPLTPGVTTLWYRSPEVLLGARQYDGAVDLWAAGCIFAELLRNAPLFPARTELAMLAAMGGVLGSPNTRIWPSVGRLPGWTTLQLPDQPHNHLKQRFPELSVSGIDLLNKLLTYDPSQRISARAALRHPFFSEHPLPKAQEFMPTFPSVHDEPEPRASSAHQARRAAEAAHTHGLKRRIDDAEARLGAAFGDLGAVHARQPVLRRVE
ncbi:hypothetical protein ACKKBG_A30030 [Auxenochlorella protothecoides x Auxenochlorella symbiontica]